MTHLAVYLFSRQDRSFCVHIRAFPRDCLWNPRKVIVCYRTMEKKWCVFGVGRVGIIWESAQNKRMAVGVAILLFSACKQPNCVSRVRRTNKSIQNAEDSPENHDQNATIYLYSPRVGALTHRRENNLSANRRTKPVNRFRYITF